MTFLNPLLLFGLAAAAIPVLIHLFSLRKLKTVEFSSLRFLRELQKTRMRRLRVRQILLLVLRTLLVVCLVLAFARPALRGSIAGTVGSHARTTMLLLIDDSPSMGVRNAGGVLFAQAREAATRIASLMRDGDELFVLPLSTIEHLESPAPLRDPSAAEAAVRALTLSQESVPYHTALAAAAKILSADRNANQELYLFTDGQGTQFTRGPVPSDSADLFDARARVFLVETPPGGTANLAVTRVRLLGSILQEGTPATLEATVHNHGEEPARGLLLSVYLEGRRVVQQSLDIPPRSPVSLTFTVVPRSTGVLIGRVQIDEDQLESDDRRSFTLPIPETVRVLLASGSPDDARFPALALGVGGDSAGRSPFALRTAGTADLGGTDLTKFDVVVLAGPGTLSESVAGRIGTFLREGGGVMFFPGSTGSTDNVNAVLFPALGIPPAGAAAGDAGAEEGSFLSVTRVDFAHPLFAGLFEEEPGGRATGRRTVDSPRIRRTIRPAVRPQDHTIAALSDGTPFLAEYRVGAGRMLLFSVEPGLTWSDFPLKGAYLPLLHRGAMYLAQRDQDRRELTVGEPVECTVRLREGMDRTSFVLRSPSGLEERMPVRSVSGAAVTLGAAHASETGALTVHARGTAPPVQAVVVHPVPEESDLQAADAGGRAGLFARVGLTEDQVRVLPPGNAIGDAVQESRFGVELWKHFLVLALVLAVAEMVLGRAPRPSAAEAGT